MALNPQGNAKRQWETNQKENIAVKMLPPEQESVIKGVSLISLHNRFAD